MNIQNKTTQYGIAAIGALSLVGLAYYFSTQSETSEKEKAKAEAKPKAKAKVEV